MKELLKLKGKTALVTGASRGIGRAIALALAREGADIAVNCSSSILEAEKVAQEIKKLGSKSIIIKADVADKTSVEKMVNAVVRQFGKIDILVNNAGMATVAPSEKLEEKVWRRGIDVMLTGTFFCSQAAGKEMIKQKRGKIINIASINGIVAFPERASYCSAKAGVMALTKVLASEWAKYNINVNSIAPGYVETELVNNLVSQRKLKIKELKGRTPSGKLISAEDVAEAAVFLASESTKSINGQSIVIDGGWTAYGYLESWLKKSYT
jgi:NAD(P)-dependent dehydrogenase (short-subunit alcohol dehydrogenase family)